LQQTQANIGEIIHVRGRIRSGDPTIKIDYLRMRFSECYVDSITSTLKDI